MIKNTITVLLCCFLHITLIGQITNFKEKYVLPNDVNETSGLLFLNGKIITHNDSGDAANLYELDSLNGNLLRTISINNATNTDWEAITQDENYIYIADIGNNNGNRTDLKILKILKADYLNNSDVSAEIISYKYEDQTDFSNRPNAHNFDAEAIINFENSLLIFSKNWSNFRTNVYKIPKTVGSHTAQIVSTANVEGLITGATNTNNGYMLCGYNSIAVPFLIYIPSSAIFGDDLFNAGFSKHTLNNELEQFSQVEAITTFNNGKFYVSREKVDSNGINLPQKLYQFEDDRTKTLNIVSNEVVDFKISPNPTSNKIVVSSNKALKSVAIFNTLGKQVYYSKEKLDEIYISNFPKGIYLIKVVLSDYQVLVKKIIKI